MESNDVNTDRETCSDQKFHSGFFKGGNWFSVFVSKKKSTAISGQASASCSC